jgi:hypothetical protein
MEIVRDIKEQMCFVNQDYQKDLCIASPFSDLEKPTHCRTGVKFN